MIRALCLALATLLAGCGASGFSRESFVFGTRVEITVAGQDEGQAGPAVDTALAELDRLHAELHPWQDSPLQRLNAALAAGRPGTLTPEIAELLRLSQTAWQRSEGLFNPALGDLVAAWGFHQADAGPHLADPARIEAWKAARPSPAQISIIGEQARSGSPAVRLDFGGIAKGWALDRVARRLRAAGVRHALINIGGNVMALGRNGERAWRVGLQHPRRAGAMLELELGDGEAVGTSGDYQRYFIADGRRYCHLLDPRTGWPAAVSSSATVLAEAGSGAGMLSDMASKPLFIDGPRHASRHARALGVRNWLVVAPDGTVYLSQAMQSRVRWLDKPAAPLIVQP